jgi:hypothetical protein
MPPVLQGLVTIVVGGFGCVGYFWASNWLLDRVIFPARGPKAGRNINRANLVRPWLFLFPAIFALGLYLAYPVIGLVLRSLYNRRGPSSSARQLRRPVGEPGSAPRCSTTSCGCWWCRRRRPSSGWWRRS